MLLIENHYYGTDDEAVDFVRITSIVSPRMAIGYIVFKDGRIRWGEWDAMGMCEDWPQWELTSFVGCVACPKPTEDSNEHP
jgi:hypothetical protein